MRGNSKKPKIFITPWIDLSSRDIDKVISAGANSARIHTGKTNTKQNIKLINYYTSRNFKFYLDLRGNKTSVEKIDNGKETAPLSVGDKVWIYEDDKYNNHINADHYLKFGFIPDAIKKLKIRNGDLNVDDGMVMFNINKLVRAGRSLIGIETIVTKAKPVWIGDGVSSATINIHSGAKLPLTKVDIDILTKIPLKIRHKVNYIAISFCEKESDIEATLKIIKELGYSNAQISPKVETIRGVKNIREICGSLRKNFGSEAELMIGRSDLIMDTLRCKRYVDPQKLVDKILDAGSKFKVKVSVLALILQSVRLRHKYDRSSDNWDPTPSELDYIYHLCHKKAYQIGLTNDMYIDNPEIMIAKLSEIIDKYSKN